MVYSVICVCTLLVSIGPYISVYYFYLTIAAISAIILVVEVSARMMYVSLHRYTSIADIDLQLRPTNTLSMKTKKLNENEEGISSNAADAQPAPLYFTKRSSISKLQRQFSA